MKSLMRERERERAAERYRADFESRAYPLHFSSYPQLSTAVARATVLEVERLRC